jgi:hypothetical protein
MLPSPKPPSENDAPPSEPRKTLLLLASAGDGAIPIMILPADFIESTDPGPPELGDTSLLLAFPYTCDIVFLLSML